jgi:signal transduction histidine kinase
MPILIPQSCGRPTRVLDAMLLSAGAELTLAASAGIGEEWFSGDDASLPLLACLFLVCMLLWFGNRCGRTKAAFGGFAAAGAAAAVLVSVMSDDRGFWLTCSAAVLSGAAVVAFGPVVSFRHILGARRYRREAARLAAIGDASSRIFHDLMNPLAAVSLSVETLDGCAPTQARHVERAKRTARRLGTRLESARRYVAPPAEPAVFDARDELLEVVESLEPRAARSSVRIELAEGSPVLLYGDRFQFFRALSNLALNAIEASEGGAAAAVIVRASCVRGRACVAVKDTGRAADVARERKRGGMGLGLPIAREILEREFGGRVAFRRMPGGGPAATVSLPLAQGRSATR